VGIVTVVRLGDGVARTRDGDGSTVFTGIDEGETLDGGGQTMVSGGIACVMFT
jgi:hypothetical protein